MQVSAPAQAQRMQTHNTPEPSTGRKVSQGCRYIQLFSVLQEAGLLGDSSLWSTWWRRLASITP